MSAEAIEFGFVSDGLVEGMAAEQAARLAHFSPHPPKLGVILGFPHPDNRSYGLQTLYHAQMLTAGREGAIPPVEFYLPTAKGFDVVTTPGQYFAAKEQGLYTPHGKQHMDAHDDRIVGLIQDLNDRKDIATILTLSPTATPVGDSRAAATIAGHKDADGASPRSNFTRATPEAALLMGEYMAGKKVGIAEGEISPDQIGCIGNGARVMAPLVNHVLPSKRGIAPHQLGMHLKGTPEIAEGLSTIPERGLRMLFIALPVGAILLSNHVPDGMVVVDMGQGWSLDGSLYAGNAHPDLVARHNPNGKPGGVKVNGLRKSGGRVTTAVVFDRTIPQPSEYPGDHFMPDGALASTAH